MSRDQRVFLAAVGEASAWDTFRTRIEAVWSGSTKSQLRRYAALHGVLGAALADSDDRVTIRLQRRHRPAARNLAGLALLGLLTTALIVEWGSYTLPAIHQYMNYVEHRCGIR